MTANGMRFGVATVKPWQLDAFHRHAPMIEGEWRLFTRPEELRPDVLADLRYLFFPHWSWLVPKNVLETVECVCFHMTDLPYGRGGSPLQNLIVRGHQETMVSALRMVEELDAGPIYLKKPLSLDGSAQEIFERLADLTWQMIAELIRTEPRPTPQTGPISIFERRQPKQSEMPGGGTLGELFDHIRMLDAETYPEAFLDHGSFRLKFRKASLQGDELVAEVTIRPREEGC